MTNEQHILLAVEDSEASMQAVRYVTQMVGGREIARVLLFHVLPPIPPQLLEFGGAEDPARERRLSAALKEKQQEWIQQAKQAAQPILDRAIAILTQGGVSPDQLQKEFAPSIHRREVVRDVLEAAKRWACGTIVVGRTSFPWYKELTYRHFGEELIQQAKGFTVWVVE